MRSMSSCCGSSERRSNNRLQGTRREASSCFASIVPARPRSRRVRAFSGYRSEGGSYAQTSTTSYSESASRRRLQAKGYEQRYELALKALKRLPYRRWRDANPEDTLRFHALRLHEGGLITENPNRLIARGTDWRSLTSSRRS